MQNTQANVLGVSANSYAVPLTVELDVFADRISDTWTLTSEAAEVEFHGDLNNIRAWAVYMSSRKHTADIIVAPVFNIKTTDNGDGYEVEVIGYPAKYVNWKSATSEDMEWIRTEKLINIKD